jgi:hypothetical protein
MVDQYKQQLDGIMQREISRGDFLKFMGAALLGVIGVTGFLKNIHEAVPSHVAVKKQLASAGYGRSAYGR